MELKIFGPGSYPSGRFKKGLDVLFDLDQDAWEVIANWFSTTESLDVQEGASAPAVLASPLTPNQFIESAEVLQYILEAWYLRGLNLNEIQSDLMVLGYASGQIGRLGELLNRLSAVQKRAFTHYMRTEYESSILPTLEDIDVACDLRPIFEGYVYPIPEKDGARHTKLLGFGYHVLIELKTEDSKGGTHRFAFQVTEKTLGDMQLSLKRAAEQLDILKAKTSALNLETT